MGVTELVTVGASAVGSLTGAFLAIKITLKNIDDRVRLNSMRIERHDERIDKHGNRLSIVETRLTFRKGDI